MKTILKTFFLIGVFYFFSCEKEVKTATISSPDNNLNVDFFLSDSGTAHYKISHKSTVVIDSSSLGFDLKDVASLDRNFKIVKTTTNSVDETWKMPWGEQESVRNHYNELTVQLQEKDALQRKLNIIFLESSISKDSSTIIASIALLLM